jgi:hypothetical protein
MTSLRATIGPLMFGVVALADANKVPAPRKPTPFQSIPHGGSSTVRPHRYISIDALQPRPPCAAEPEHRDAMV